MEHEVFVPFPAGRLREALADPVRIARAIPGLQQDASAVSDGAADTAAPPASGTGQDAAAGTGQDAASGTEQDAVSGSDDAAEMPSPSAASRARGSPGA